MNKIVILLCLVFCVTTYSQNDLPNIELNTLDGTKITINDATNEDNVYIVSLWATWCVPCIKELDAISEVYTDWQDETNVQLVAVSVDDSRTVKRVRPLINGKSWDYEILLDTNNDLKRALGAATVPLTLLVKDNKIIYKHSGYNPGSEFELYEKILEFSN
jgi:thiol-disulfide isomerase/thioredoxin